MKREVHYLNLIFKIFYYLANSDYFCGLETISFHWQIE